MLYLLGNQLGLRITSWYLFSMINKLNAQPKKKKKMGLKSNSPLHCSLQKEPIFLQYWGLNLVPQNKVFIFVCYDINIEKKCSVLCKKYLHIWCWISLYSLYRVQEETDKLKWYFGRWFDRQYSLQAKSSSEKCYLPNELGKTVFIGSCKHK